MSGLPDEYCRSTNPERFLEFHKNVAALLDRLAREYEVVQTEAFKPLPMIRGSAHIRPPVTLTPQSGDAPAISVMFCEGPGLVLRVGDWAHELMPPCLCDACNPSPEREYEKFEQLVGDVVDGYFRETLTTPLFRSAKLTWRFGSGSRGHESGGTRTLRPEEAEAFQQTRSRRKKWQPWKRREVLR